MDHSLRYAEDVTLWYLLSFSNTIFHLPRTTFDLIILDSKSIDKFSNKAADTKAIII